MMRLDKLWIAFFAGLVVSAGGCFQRNNIPEQELSVVPVIEAGDTIEKTVLKEDVIAAGEPEVSILDVESIVPFEDAVPDDEEIKQEIISGEEITVYDGPKISDLDAGIISLIYDFLDVFFEGGEYTLLENPHNVGPRHIYYAVHYIIVDKRELIDCAAGFEIIDGSVVSLFHFKEKKFFDRAGKVISDYSDTGIFGFKIHPVHSSRPRDAYLFFTPYSDGSRYNSSNYEGDSFRKFWNEEKRVFESLSMDDPRWLPSY